MRRKHLNVVADHGRANFDYFLTISCVFYFNMQVTSDYSFQKVLSNLWNEAQQKYLVALNGNTQVR